MGRGRIEIRMIENPTNRQVTYSKRRGGIKKKAEELTVLCDAEVSILMISNTGKLFEYCSPSTNIKGMVDRYQQVTGIDLWKPQYEMMQKKLDHLKETNNRLRREIRQRMGEDELEGLDVKELRGLEQEIDASLKAVRERKYHVISTQTETYKKKVRKELSLFHLLSDFMLRNSELAHHKLLHDVLRMGGCEEAMDYNIYHGVSEYEGETGGVVDQPAFALQVQPSQADLCETGYGFRELRLA